MITIGFLADHPEVIPTLAAWFRAQWSDYYAGRSQEEMEQGFHVEASRDRLPIRLVAFESGELAGTIVLREDGTASLPGFQPELGGLYVAASQRTRGIGTELIQAGMELARQQGYPAVYATTLAARGILERLGWEYVKEVTHHDEKLAWYRCKL